MTRAEVTALLDQWREAYERKDYTFFDRLFDENIEMTMHGPPQAFPAPTTLYGRSAAIDAIKRVDEALAVVRNTVRLILADDDLAAVISDRTLIQRATGRTLTYKVAAFLRFRERRIVEYQLFYDSFELLEQVLGRTLDVPQGYPR